MNTSALKQAPAEPLLPDALAADALAAYIKAAGDEARLTILRLLRNNAYGVLELSELLGMKQTAMSHHLKVLSSAGLVSTRREGNSIFYRRTLTPSNPVLADLHISLQATVDALQLDAAIEARVENIHHQRSEASREFFEQNLSRFRRNQDLIASYRDYGSAILELLDSVATQRHSALEVGSGQGELLSELCARFEAVTAVDISEDLLSLAQEQAQKAGLTNLRFILADITKTVPSEPSDCITLNMVLHHLANPQAAFETLSGALKPGGCLIVTDLFEHDQDWVHESCGDVWRGFAPQQLNEWAGKAGLVEAQEVFLSLRNGFRVQIKSFTKPRNESAL